MAKTVAVCNQKGGVGKTTTVVNMGTGLARMGYKVLLVDADPQGDLTTSLGWHNQDDIETTLSSLMDDYINDRDTDIREAVLHHAEGVDLIPGNIELSAMEMKLVTTMSREQLLGNMLTAVKPDYDYIIIDCMPSLGMMTINALTAADGVVIPVQAQYLPTKGMTQLLQTINRVKRHINHNLNIDGILITLADKKTNLTNDVIRTINDGFGKYINVYDTNIPEGVAAAYASSEGTSVYAYERKSSVAEAYISFIREYTGYDAYTLTEIKVSGIHDTASYPRPYSNMGSLIKSISENGVKKPIEVYTDENGDMRIIDGSRRVKACAALGIAAIPAKVFDISAERAERICAAVQDTYCLATHLNGQPKFKNESRTTERQVI